VVDQGSSEGRSSGNKIVPKLGTYVPTLGTIGTSPLADALFGQVRGLVLALFFGHLERPFYTREVIEALDAGQGGVQRELRRLSAAGILVRERQGREVYYRANPDCPIYAELKGLMLKTLGLADVLRSSLSDLSDRIDVAFVYGSMAKGTGRVGSDVDVMVMGSVSFAEVTNALGDIEEVLGREVNPSVYSTQEFRNRLTRGDHFISTVLDEPKLFLIGRQDDLDRLAGHRLADHTRDEQAGDR
jgi:uncharacterized protein